MADGTHKDKSPNSMTGPWFLDVQYDPEIKHLIERCNIDIATVVTEDSQIFPSIPGETNIRGKGSQFETAFNFIHHFVSKKEDKENNFVMCIDSDLEGTNGYVYRMCLGLHQGYSYLVPLYWRHKYEGRATNHLMFPLYSSIVRKGLRQPIGGEFAFNGKMLARFTDTKKWKIGWREFGVDMGMTIIAGLSGDPVGQLILPRKINYVGDDARKQIGDMIVQGGRSLFNGLIDFLESNCWKPTSLTMAPQVEIEAVTNDNTTVNISDSAEIVSALYNFIFMYNNQAYQDNAKGVLGEVLSDRIKQAYQEFQAQNLTSSAAEGKTRAPTSKSKQLEVVNKLKGLNVSAFLKSDEWATIVFQCLAEFQARRCENEEQACKTVIRGVLLCVFYLRVLSFNVQTLHLRTFPDAEDLVVQQMQEFCKVATAKLPMSSVIALE